MKKKTIEYHKKAIEVLTDQLKTVRTESKKTKIENRIVYNRERLKILEGTAK